MKVAIIGTVGVPACYGGYETLVENMLTYKQRKDIEYHVYCSSKVYKNKITEYKGAKLKYVPLNANGPMGIPYDICSYIHALFTCDEILSLGTGCSYVLPFFRIFTRKRIIVNLDGLDNTRAKFSSFPQKIIAGARWLAAKLADVRISDNQGIKEYAKNVYKRDSVLIEYGGDNAVPIHDDIKLNEKYGLKPQGYVFKVARIEPENNIAMILKAFTDMPEETLVIVGNWNKNDYGRKMREKYGQLPNIILLDSIYESSEINLLRSNCKLYIHGHSVGGTNPSLVEAMSLQLPIIAFDVVYNRETTENKAYYFRSSEDLINEVIYLINNQEKRNELASSMKEIADRRYTWKIISNKYESLFKY